MVSVISADCMYAHVKREIAPQIFATGVEIIFVEIVKKDACVCNSKSCIYISTFYICQKYNILFISVMYI